MDFVSFELAKKLKEKGFNAECHAYYEPLKHCLNLGRVFKTNSLAENYNCITAPTISQVLKWLREEKGYHIEFIGNACGYLFVISDIPSKGGTDRYCSDYNGPNDGGTWDSYEQAALAGIEYVLDNLI